MMNIEENNQIIYDALYKNITKNTKAIKIFHEFGYFNYAIFSEVTDISSKIFDNIIMILDTVCFGFKSDDFAKIYEYSGKECLASDFGSKIISNSIKISNRLRICLRCKRTEY